MTSIESYSYDSELSLFLTLTFLNNCNTKIVSLMQLFKCTVYTLYLCCAYIYVYVLSFVYYKCKIFCFNANYTSLAKGAVNSNALES